ncbi:hypothetical protein IU459_27175 [Nocardia amamiensis]|uniref:Uncharacterized protein n=1 Tax=Nocardia amamiensis TaxID=404578 RepID=A0ABS0D245_9NOCA|nr:hypothetical protein [Nocardia amamiensis]MBF6301199.1 hypothetical protein [Nocardia amamiensis]
MASTTFVDVETTAAHLRRRPWEIHLIQEFEKYSGDPVECREINIQITKVDLTYAEPAALKIGRFHQRHVEYATDRGPDAPPVLWWPAAHTPDIPAGTTPAEHAATTIDEAIADGGIDPATVFAVDEPTAAVLVSRWTAGTNIVGLNPNFDTETFAWMLDRHGLDAEPWDYHLTNIATEAAGWLRGQLGVSYAAAMAEGGLAAAAAEPLRITLALLERLPRNSALLSRLCGVEPPAPGQAHAARADALWVRRWWHRMQMGAITYA